MHLRDNLCNNRYKILYRMDEKWIYQPWYNPNSIFRLKKMTHFRMEQFGVDCIWEDITNNSLINHWDNTMRPLNKEEVREFNINKIIK